MKYFFPLLLLLLVGSLSTATFAATKGIPQDGMDAYRARDFAKARAIFEKAVAHDSNNADLHAWLSATYVREDNREAAEASAKRALAIDPHNSFAHAMLGRIYNPRYSQYENVDAEQSWIHLNKAVESDPKNGDAWTLIWIDAMERGDAAMEQKALQNIDASHFFPRSVMNYARWTLDELPRDAILLTNGDLDTFPTVALQRAQFVRPDVGVINLSLLNLPWYIEMVCARYGLPTPVPSGEVKDMAPKRVNDDKWSLVRDQVVDAWMAAVDEGTFPRPLTVALTVPVGMIMPAAAEKSSYQGAYWLYAPGVEPMDLAKVEIALKAADALDFTGAVVNPDDPSPLRNGASLLQNVTAMALKLCDAYLDADRPSDALATVAWAERFQAETNVTKIPTLAAFKEKAQKAMEEGEQ